MKTYLALLLIIWGTGCNSVDRAFSYRVIVVNLSEERISENRIFDSSGEYNYGCGNIGPGGYKANAGPMETAPNDVFTVRWKDEQLREREQKFDLRGRVKRKFKGEIVFVYGANETLAAEIWDAPKQYPLPHGRNPKDRAPLRNGGGHVLLLFRG